MHVRFWGVASALARTSREPRLNFSSQSNCYQEQQRTSCHRIVSNRRSLMGADGAKSILT
jgi:hypothetical protein